MNQKFSILLTFFLLFSCISFLQAQGSITTNDSTGCAPFTAVFQGINIPNPSNVQSYSWTFGNGQSVSGPAASTTHTYSTAGNYTVTLYVNYTNGTKDTIVRANFIDVFTPPTVGFSATPTQICVGQQVCFTDLSVAGSGAITTWQWDFGDGTGGTQQNPCHVYNVTGNFPVSLVITDVNGCTDFITNLGYITVSNLPQANFSFSPLAVCNATTPINFIWSGAGAVTHSWNFGNGATSTAASPTYTYPANGTYTVTHIVTQGGCSTTFNQTIQIGITPPTIYLQTANSQVCVGQAKCVAWSPIAFHTISWNSGGGTPATSTANSPCFTYATPGAHTITATMTDTNTGCSSTATLNITALAAPTVAFTATNNTACQTPLPVSFSSTVTGGTTYSWHFGTGTATSSVPNPTFTYNSTGQFDVSLTVTNAAGCSTTVIQNNIVTVQPPVAAFTAVPSPQGCVPYTLTFNDQSTSNPGTITAWEWDLGATATPPSSTLQNPSVTYNSVGQYSITLIVTNSLGCKDTLKKTNYVKVGTPPIVNFSVSDTNFCASQIITFTNMSTPSNAACQWDFGDGGISTLQNPTYTYTDTGYFDVTLIVNNQGCRDTLVRPNSMHVLAPVVKFSFTPTQACVAPTNVLFNNQSVFDPNSSLYDWDYGDGSAHATVANPGTHNYLSTGNYNIILNITDLNTGCSGTMTKTLEIQPIDASFVANITQSCAPDSVFFFNISASPSSSSWDFGDGSPLSTQTNPVHTYTTPGIYTVSLIVSNTIGCKDTLVQTNYINMNGLPVAFEADTTLACAPATINFTDNTLQNVAINTWSWNFGDGSAPITTTSPNVSHNYATGDTFTVTLSVLDANGCNSSLTQTQYVQINQPTAAFSATYPINCINNPVQFNSTSTGAGLYYQWSYGDGQNSTISQANPTHNYLSNGNYNVSLLVTDIIGCTATATFNNYITIGTVVADFTPNGNITASCPPLLTGFTPSLSPPFTITQFLWDFGDGGNSNLQNPTHTYTLAGPYTVTFIAISNAGCRDTIVKPNFINIDGPISTYSVTPLQTCPGIPVTFAPVNPLNVVQYEWNFGDGNFGASATSTHAYASPGSYQPILTIWDANQCKVILPTSATVLVEVPPIASFTVDSVYACVPAAVVFTDLSAIGSGPLTSWTWSFGDGNTNTTTNPSANYTYNTSGYMDVNLIITDNHGCKDTLKQDDMLYLVPNNQPIAPKIYTATVISDDSVKIIFSSFNNAIGDFGHYEIERSNDGGFTYNSVAYIQNLQDTAYTDFVSAADSQSYCYRLYHVNHCGTRSLASATHCTISLTTTSLQDAVQLDWTAYQGWTQVEKYRIWKVQGYYNLNAVLVDSVAANVYTYTHTNLNCNVPYTYRIEALESASNWRSWSDTSTKITQHYTALSTTDMGVATVVNNQSVLVKWEIPATISKLQYVSIQRKEVNAATFQSLGVFSQPNLPTQFEDKTVNVTKRYMYRIQAADSCGDVTPFGRTGQNMTISAGRSGEEIHVHWNPYLDWAGGVDHYSLELLNKDSQAWIPIANLSGTDTFYIDERPRYFQDVNCYRVRAYKMGDLQTSSLSNQGCTSTDAQVFIPNAFTPNNDSNNDFFEIKGNYIARFELSITDRWGVEVFNSNNIDFSWDGTFKGKPVPEGVYMYRLFIQGVSGNSNKYKGSITLLR